MPKALHLPFRDGDATQVGAKLFRKQILPVGKIEHEGETLEFTKDYLEGLAESFNGGAFDQVPFLLANERNEHHSDPEKFRGELRGVEVGSDGLYGLIELSEEGTKLVADNPKLGVSARIVRGLEKDRDALQHVLGTLDPKATGMKPWEQVSLSKHADLEVTDLAGAEYSPLVDGLSDDEKQRLTDLVKKAGKDGVAEALKDVDLSNVSDEDAERIVADLLKQIESDDDPKPVTLSEKDRKAIELANETATRAEREAASLRSTLATERFERKRTELLEAGVPPALVDLAEPVLKGGEGTIELSNGVKVDAHNAMSKMLEECKGMIELSTIGVGSGDPGTEEARAKQLAEQWAKQGGS